MRWDLLAAGVDMGEGVMIEEDMIADMHLEADIVEDIEVDQGVTPRIERSRVARQLLALQKH